MSQHLDSDQINRLWQHAAHSQNRFDNRLNFFLVFESVLLGVVGVLYSRPSPAKIMLIALICLGFVLTFFWGYIQARERYLLNDLEAQLKEVAPEYRETMMRRERTKWPISSTLLLAYGVPSLVAIIWIVLFFFTAST
jgi:hypothetical protein